MKAHSATSYLGLQTEPNSRPFGNDHWRLGQDQIEMVAHTIDRVGLAHPSVAKLGWPMRSRTTLLGEPYWRLDLRQLVALAEVLDLPAR